MTDPRRPDDVEALRLEIRNQRDDHLRLEGELKGDRRIADERHAQTQAQNHKIESDIATLSDRVNDLRDAIGDVGIDVRSIVQRLDSDDTKRVDTARALKEADEARRTREAGPWITPNRIIVLVLGLLSIMGYIGTRL